jgi:hypothetical protein
MLLQLEEEKKKEKEEEGTVAWREGRKRTKREVMMLSTRCGQKKKKKWNKCSVFGLRLFWCNFWLFVEVLVRDWRL